MTHHSEDERRELIYVLDEELSDVANLLGKDEVGSIADAILAAGFHLSESADS